MGRTKIHDVDIYNLWKVYQSPENKHLKSFREILAEIKREHKIDLSEDALKSAVNKYGHENLQKLHLMFNPQHIADDYTWAENYGENLLEEFPELKKYSVMKFIKEICSWDTRTRKTKTK